MKKYGIIKRPIVLTMYLYFRLVMFPFNFLCHLTVLGRGNYYAGIIMMETLSQLNVRAPAPSFMFNMERLQILRQFELLLWNIYNYLCSLIREFLKNNKNFILKRISICPPLYIRTGVGAVAAQFLRSRIIFCRSRIKLCGQNGQYYLRFFIRILIKKNNKSQPRVDFYLPK
jgi:hypothetical protein